QHQHTACRAGWKDLAHAGPILHGCDIRSEISLADNASTLLRRGAVLFQLTAKILAAMFGEASRCGCSAGRVCFEDCRIWTLFLCSAGILPPGKCRRDGATRMACD